MKKKTFVCAPKVILCLKKSVKRWKNILYMSKQDTTHLNECIKRWTPRQPIFRINIFFDYRILFLLALSLSLVRVFYFIEWKVHSRWLSNLRSARRKIESKERKSWSLICCLFTLLRLFDTYKETVKTLLNKYIYRAQLQSHAG
jgi:hypothetical protein